MDYDKAEIQALEALPDRPRSPASEPVSEDIRGEVAGALPAVPLAPAEILELTLVYPIEGIFDCQACRAERRISSFLEARDVVRHKETTHPRLRLNVVCRGCRRSFPGLNNVRSHRPHCRGEPQPPGGGEFPCSACDRSFHSKNGLSQHERKAHPAVRNLARVAEQQPKPPRVREGKEWSQGEIALLQELEERFAGQRHINKSMEPFFPGKTNKQISSKRSDLARRERRREGVGVLVATGQEGNQRVPLDITLNSEAINICQDVYGSVDSVEDDRLEEVSWRKALAASAVRTFAKERGTLKGVFLEPGCRLNEVGENLAKGSPGSDAHQEIEQVIDIITSTLAKGIAPKALRTQTEKRDNKRGKNRTARRRHNYAVVQNLAKNDMKSLASIVVENRLQELEVDRAAPPPAEQVGALYNSLWGVRGEQSFPPTWKREYERKSIIVLLPPIQLATVVKKHKSLKANTAAGPDGIGRGDIPREALVLMTVVYNLCLAADLFPACWKKNRTTLIPKAGKNTDLAANWRPITIGSLFGRMFSGIIDASLRTNTRFSYRQKGFTSESGAFNNAALLQQILKNMKQESGGVCSILDISKAFDTVPHGAIAPALGRLGIPSCITGYILQMYRGCATSIRCLDGDARVGLVRGVKQGDPLSPFIFNAVVDPILHFLERRDRGILLNGRKISVLAFADDLTLVSESNKEAHEDLSLVYEYFRTLGMELSLAKCSAFAIKCAARTWSVNDPNLVLNGERVGYVDPERRFKYLGITFTPWEGICGKLACQDFVESCGRVEQLALKPQQKLRLMFEYIYPRFRYAMATDVPSVQALREADKEVRQIVRKVFHLPDSVTEQVFYTRVKDGGLGIPRMEIDIQFALLRSVARMATSEDDVLRLLSNDSIKAKQAAVSARNLGIPTPYSVRTLDLAKQRKRASEHVRWSELTCQGQGVEHFRGSSVSNAWLRQELLLPSRVIDAIRLRTNTTGTRTALRRAGYDHLPFLCRKCELRPETLSHVCGGCPFLKPSVIRRHDEIGRIVSDKYAQRFSDAVILHEPTFSLPDGTRLKPDLVIRNQDRVFVVDFTVRYEDGDSLQEAYREKRAKYVDLKEQLLERLGGSNFETHGLVVGARGAIPKETQRVLKTLSIWSKSLALTLSLTALRSTLEMTNSFFDL